MAQRERDSRIAWPEEDLLDTLIDCGSSESGRLALRHRLSINTNSSPLLSGGDIDAQWEMAESTGDETACGSSCTPDQNGVDAFGEAMGIVYEDGEELWLEEKEHDRDRHRWELDPASSEDYKTRRRKYEC
jgi:hypothetical protein